MFQSLPRDSLFPNARRSPATDTSRMKFQSLPRDSLFPNTGSGVALTTRRMLVSIPPSGFSLPKQARVRMAGDPRKGGFNPSLGILSSQTCPVRSGTSSPFLFQSLPRDSLFPNCLAGRALCSGNREVSIPPSGFSLPKRVVEVAHGRVWPGFNPSLGILSSQTPGKPADGPHPLPVSIPPSGFSLPKLAVVIQMVYDPKFVSIPPSGFSLPKLPRGEFGGQVMNLVSIPPSGFSLPKPWQT